MIPFYINRQRWYVTFVYPISRLLVDRTGELRVATTDPSSHIVYLSEDLRGDFLIRVLLHELGHCVIISYDLLKDIRRMVYPEYWIEAEEWICNFLADHSLMVAFTAKSILKGVLL